MAIRCISFGKFSKKGVSFSPFLKKNFEKFSEIHRILEQKGLKSVKRVLKIIYFSYFKNYPYIGDFWEKIDGAPIRNTSKIFGQKVFLIGPTVFFYTGGA